MKKITFKSSLIILIIILAVSIFAFSRVNEGRAENDLAKKMAGKILLQVEEKGEAWYVVPGEENKRVFLDKPEQALLTMVQYGVGIRSNDLRRIPVSLDFLSGHDSDGDGLPDDFEKAYGTNHLKSDSDSDGYNDLLELQNNYDPNYGDAYKMTYDNDFSQKNAGRIFIDVEESGAAWYINPENNKRYYLGRPDNAFDIMKNLGIGISNDNLAKIPAISSGSFYVNNEFGFSLKMPDSWKNYLVDEKFQDFKFDNKIYQVKEISLGLPANEEDLEDEYYNLEEESFASMITIYVLNYSDYQYMKDSGYNFSSSDYMYDLVEIDRNSEYVFLRDKDIYSSSYSNDYIYDRKQEALLFVDSMETLNLDNKGRLNSLIDATNLCKDDLVAAASGGSIFAVQDNFKHLDNFGPLFTATYCDNDRIQEIPGVTGDYYYHGSWLKLKDSPTNSLLNNLKEAGYHCNYTRISDKNCTEWLLDEVTELDEVLDLKPYYNEIVQDNCVMCGEDEE